MGFFSGLKKVFNPGGVVVSKVVGDGHDYKGLLDYAMNGKKNGAAAGAQPFDPGQRTGATINGQSGVAQPSMQLGWTNGGYNYHNSPFNQSPQIPSPPMSFGGTGQPPPRSTAMGMQPSLGGGLQPAPRGGSMPPAGAQPPQGPPTMQIPQDPQRIQAMMLRGGGP